MAVDDVKIKSSVGVDGNSYTTSISNDKLTNQDFLTLLLEEMKMQDPTKPMDGDRMMDTQLKMSTIESNKDMTNSIQSLEKSYKQSALATSSSMIGHTVEDGSKDDKGVLNSYLVGSVRSEDGDIFLVTNKLIGYNEEDDKIIYSTDETLINFNNVKKINT